MQLAGMRPGEVKPLNKKEMKAVQAALREYRDATASATAAVKKRTGKKADPQ